MRPLGVSEFFSVSLVGAGTVENFGIISSGSTQGTAVLFGAGDDKLVVVPGAIFLGKVDGGAGNNVIELAAGPQQGWLTSVGSSIINFSALRLDEGAVWKVGLDTQFAGTIYGVARGDSLDLTNLPYTSTGSVTLQSNNVLHVTGNGTAYNVKLDPGQDFSATVFELSADGATETLVSVNAGARFSQNISAYSIQNFGTKVFINGADANQFFSGVTLFQFADGIADTNDGNLLVDALYYDSRNTDVFHAGANPATHYDQYGWHEGRDPDAYFGTAQYLNVYSDVKAAGINPLSHYDEYGWHEGRNPSIRFDTNFYLAQNSDVKAAGIDPLVHYLQYGNAEGRLIEPAVGRRITATDFDPDYYLMANPDVALSGIDPYQHFLTYGWHEGRNPNAFFDINYYEVNNADVMGAGVNPLIHYEQYGWKEGRNPSPIFDTKQYLASNPDVAAAHIDPLQHYLVYGINEGRLP